MSTLDPTPSAAPHLTLASRSARRRELLSRLCGSFDCVPAEHVDESAESGAALEVARRLALLKASEVFERLRQNSVGAGDSEHWVLGADTLIAVGGGSGERILGKPRDVAEAKRMLTSLGGRSHRVVTGLALCRSDRAPRLAVETTEVRLRTLTAARIDAYVETGEPLDKAGAYGIQGEGAALVAGIRGCFYNVVGLPLTLTARLLGPLCGPDAKLCDCRSHPLQLGTPGCDGRKGSRGQGIEGSREE